MTEASDRYLRELDSSARLRFEPTLLCLATLLGTLPLFPPNMNALYMPLMDLYPLKEYMTALSLSCCSFGLILTVVSLSRREWQGFSRGTGLAAALAFTALQLLLLTSATLGSNSPLAAIVLGIFGGAALPIVLLGWIRRYPKDLRNIMFHGGLVCAIGTGVNVALSALDGIPLAISIVVLVAVGTITPFVGTHTGVDPEPDALQGAVANPWMAVLDLLSIIWLPLLGTLLLVFMSSYYSILQEGLLPLPSELCGQIVAAAITLAVVVPNLRRPVVVVIDRAIIPLCVAVCLVLGSFPDGSPLFLLGAYTIYAPLFFMTVYGVGSIVVVSARGEFPIPFIFGLGFFAVNLAGFFGGMLSVEAPLANMGEVCWTIICCYFAIVILSLGARLWQSDGCNEDEGVGDPDSRKTPPSKTTDFSARVDMTARKFELSEREREILAYIGQGHNSTYVAQCLFISANTVRTHVRNIYRKLGVNNRSELLVLLNSQD